jgi:hypothetical protein
MLAGTEHTPLTTGPGGNLAAKGLTWQALSQINIGLALKRVGDLWIGKESHP